MMTSPKITVRKFDERGRSELGWLSSRFSFSFADYHDPAHTGFRSLRVINEDRIAPGKGFDTHAHHDMEIITYVIEGELAHKDSMGNGSIIKAGNLQRMSAGTGVKHSEFNPSQANEAHLLQIWIHPDTKGLPPSYQELNVGKISGEGLTLVAAKEGPKGTLKIHQDAKIHIGRLKAKGRTEFSFQKSRGLWLQMIKGEIAVNDVALAAGDGVSIENEAKISITAQQDAEFLLFDLK